MNLVDFYLGRVADYKGRTLQEIWAWDHEKLEEVHDYIQVLFPLTEASQFVSRAPVLHQDEVEQFRGNATIRKNLHHSFELMLDFYGLECNGRPPRVSKASHFAERAQNWLVYGDHNHLRITRILKCLRLCGPDAAARAFLSCLLELRDEYPAEISDETLGFWRDAVTFEPGRTE
jgi:hypothetical protein